MIAAGTAGRLGFSGRKTEKDDAEPSPTDRFHGRRRGNPQHARRQEGRHPEGRYTKKNGERKDYPTWHQVEIWNQATVNWLASKGLAKGSKVFVQGEIRHDRYTDNDGVERFFSKVVIAMPGHELKSLDRPEHNPADED